MTETKTLKLTQMNLTAQEIKKIYNKTYYESNRDKYEIRKQKKNCLLCGGSYHYYNASRHRKTLKCTRALNKIKDIRDAYSSTVNLNI